MYSSSVKDSTSNEGLLAISSHTSNNLLNTVSMKKYSTSSSKSENIDKSDIKVKSISLENTLSMAKLLSDAIANISLIIDKECNILDTLLNYNDSKQNNYLIYKRLDNLFEIYGFDNLGKVMQILISKNINKAYIVEELCIYLEKFDYEEVMPWGGFLVSTLINNKNDIIKESAINLIDNWKEESMLNLLRNVEVSSSWMRKYIDNTIESFKR